MFTDSVVASVKGISQRRVDSVKTLWCEFISAEDLILFNFDNAERCCGKSCLNKIVKIPHEFVNFISLQLCCENSLSRLFCTGNDCIGAQINGQFDFYLLLCHSGILFVQKSAVFALC